mgnify:CR=1 FL=1
MDSEAEAETGEPQEPIEVEVERLNQEQGSHGTASSYGRAMGPVLAGFIIDVLDFATFGSAGLYLGLLMGCPAGWYLARSFGLDHRRSLYFALACGVYCTIPVTSPVPIATLLGVWLRARQSA